MRPPWHRSSAHTPAASLSLVRRQTKNTSTMKIKFATDGVADLPKALLEKYDIAVVPSYVNYGGRSMADDGRELSREKFYQDLPNLTTHATTAAPPPALAEEILARHFEGADH